MGRSKIAITLDEKSVVELDRLVSEHRFPNRSLAIQEAVDEKLGRLSHNRRAGVRQTRPRPRTGLGRAGHGRGVGRVARILRGEIRWATWPDRGNEQTGRRPVLRLSADVFNERSGTVIGVDLTSQAPRAGFPLTLELDSASCRRYPG